jgi:hypothetical protein
MAAHIVPPAIHLVFSDPKTWALGVYRGVRHKHLKAYLDEFTFRFNRRKSRHAAFATLLGIATAIKPATYKMFSTTGFNGISNIYFAFVSCRSCCVANHRLGRPARAMHRQRAALPRRLYAHGRRR